MSRKNSRFQKAVRRELREQQQERAKFVHDLSKETVHFKNRKERRNER